MRHFARAKRGPNSFDMNNFLWKDHGHASRSQNVISLNLASFGFVACGCGESAGEKCFTDTVALLLCGCMFTMTCKFNCYFFKNSATIQKIYLTIILMSLNMFVQSSVWFLVRINIQFSVWFCSGYQYSYPCHGMASRFWRISVISIVSIDSWIDLKKIK